MRRLAERLVGSLGLDSRARRVLDETLNDWRHEDEAVQSAFQRWLGDGRSAWAVVRALVLVSWWKPHRAMAQAAAGPASARDEMINVINRLSPDSSYDDILKELGRLQASKGEPGLAPATPPSRVDAAFWRRTARIAALFLLVSAAGAAWQTYGTTPMYRATAKVVIEPATVDQQAYMATEMTILQSRALRLRVVRKLHLDATATDSSTRSSAAGEAETPAEGRAVDDIAAHLSVTTEPGTSLVSFSYSAPSPEVAAMIANAIAREYVASNLERKRHAITDELSAIQERLGDAQTQLEAHKKRVLQQAATASVVDPAFLMANVSEAQREYNARAHAADAAGVTARELVKLDLEGAMRAPEIAKEASPLRQIVSSLENEKRQAENRGLGSTNPVMSDIVDRLNKARTDLEAYVRGYVEGAQRAWATAEAQKLQAQKQLEAQNAIAQRNSQAAISYQSAREALQGYQTTYQDLLIQRSRLELLSRGISNNVTLAETAGIPRRPYTPNTLVNFSAWMSAGLFFALLAAFGIRPRRAQQRPALAV